MKAKLVFNDWQRNGQSIYNTEEGIDLSMGDLHSGTIFHCDVTFDVDAEHIAKELAQATKSAAVAVFLLIPEGPDNDTA